MVRTDNKIIAIVGLNCTGDLGPWTFYRSSRGQLVFYARVPALNPASARQRLQRHRWRAAAFFWRLTDAQTKKNWEAATRGARLKMTGYNLWVYWVCHRDAATLQTIERQSGIDLGIF